MTAARVKGRSGGDRFPRVPFEVGPMFRRGLTASTGGGQDGRLAYLIDRRKTKAASSRRMRHTTALVPNPQGLHSGRIVLS
jgi:hypothetical protein